jgi:predicted regulator of Ras-like GTPase activity (Roadblock/LC7/MglB family)
MTNYQPQLETLTRFRGIRGAMVVVAVDGLVVAEALMGDVRGASVAALAASLTGRAAGLSQRGGFGMPRFLHLQCEDGALLAAPAGTDLVLVAVAGRDVSLGLIRLEMLRLAERLT